MYGATLVSNRIWRFFRSCTSGRVWRCFSKELRRSLDEALRWDSSMDILKGWNGEGRIRGAKVEGKGKSSGLGRVTRGSYTSYIIRNNFTRFG